MQKIYNTKLQKKVKLCSLTPKKIKIYVCGVTVYNDCHIGHARTYVAFDTIIRFLEYSGYEVEYVRNITDIDDKIIKQALVENVDFTEITQRYIQSMQEDFALLGLQAPTHEPLATDYVPQMISLIEKLIASKHAYVAQNNDVYYSVASFANYGQLTHQSLQDFMAGQRVQVSSVKKAAEDFVLWKHAKPNEPSWDSPWGPGRPGWHIECSAMAGDILGETFDIHGGGFDLICPHHENECAQSEAISKKPLANLWMHSGFLNINKEKMAKSIGNFITIKQVLSKTNPQVLRFLLLSGHYRSQLEYSDALLANAKNSMDRLYQALRNLNLDTPVATCNTAKAYQSQFIQAMHDDFNTPKAIAVLFEIAKHINSLKESDLPEASSFGALLLELAHSLGLMNITAKQYFTADVDIAKIENLMLARTKARAQKDWQQSDFIRQQLAELGVLAEDKNGSSSWRKK